MRRTLRLRSGEYEILSRSICSWGESGYTLDPAAAAHLLRASANDPDTMRCLRQVLVEQLGEHGLQRRSDTEVIDHLVRMLATRRLGLRSLVTVSAQTAPPSPEPDAEPEEERTPPPPRPRPTKKLDWIEIVLIDEEENPVVGEKCQVSAPDGAMIGTYTTDSNGTVRVDDIESGSYEVAFPSLS